MILQEKFPRATVFWILFAQCAVFIPHLNQVPIWLSILYFACIGWRFGIYQGRWDFPNKWVKGFLIIAAFISVLASFQTISGAKGGVALLLIAFAYKSLEMKEQRDAYLVVMLAYFVVACAFLYQRSFFAAGYLIVCVGIVSAALISMNHLPRNNFDFDGLKLSFKMLIQAIPLMIFLFIFFPQLPPLFQINLGGNDAKTGLSDTLNPGSISDLTQSDELAFRVKFTNGMPPKNQLYWRAQLFERFDGISWTVSPKQKSELHYTDVFPAESFTDEGQKHTIEYEVYQEASYSKMLFSLATAWVHASNVQLNSDYTIDKTSPVDGLFHYKVESNTALKRDLELSERSRELNLLVPLYGNEKAKEYAIELRKKSKDEQEFVLKVLSAFTENGFQYTLNPPLLGANPVDEFLFDTRKGFCEHFASSFVYLMRAGGIPARIVAGYMGGEYNKQGDYVLVHQFQAHAWAEVWLEGQGWVRFDPTAWVAPDRINQGIEEALPDGESILEGNLLAARKFDALTEIRLQLDYLNMQWDKWVLGYDETLQMQVFNKLLGKVTSTRISVFMLLCFSFVVLATSLAIFFKDFFRVKDPADRLYFSMQKKLKNKHIERQPFETPNDFAQRINTKDASLGKALQSFTHVYVKLKYQKEWNKKERDFLLKEMREALKSV